MRKLAIIGTGKFSMFACAEILKNNEISLVGILDSNMDHATEFQSVFEGEIFNDITQITTNQDIDLVYIATPPWLHYTYAKACLLASKHVICEKPAALNLDEVEELIQIANEQDKLYVVNLMQRYNPIFCFVKHIIEHNILGHFLHGFFENYASDEYLNQDHWFWDEDRSGGIFIEHAVHFFDLFEGWFGEGKLLSSLEMKRTNSPIEKKAADRVQATVQYGEGLVNFYHGFDQPTKLDRQEIRLVFEKGNINLYEWVPNKMKIEGLVTKEELETLKSITQFTAINMLENYSGEKRITRGRFKQIVADYKVDLIHQGDSKTAIYKRLISDMIDDQLQWIENRKHNRLITGQNAYNSTKMAIEAHRNAQIIET